LHYVENVESEALDMWHYSNAMPRTKTDYGEAYFHCQWTSCLEQLAWWTSVTWHLAGHFQSQTEDISV